MLLSRKPTRQTKSLDLLPSRRNTLGRVKCAKCVSASLKERKNEQFDLRHVESVGFTSRRVDPKESEATNR